MRQLSTDAVASQMSQSSDIVWLVLITIDHEDITDGPLRLVNNTEDIVSRSNTFTRFPFRIALPSDYEDRPPTCTLQIDNVDQQVTAAIQEISSAPTVTIEIITTEDLDTVEIGPMEFTLNNITFTRDLVEGTLRYEQVLELAYPAARFTPNKFPALFQ